MTNVDDAPRTKTAASGAVIAALLWSSLASVACELPQYQPPPLADPHGDVPEAEELEGAADSPESEAETPADAAIEAADVQVVADEADAPTPQDVSTPTVPEEELARRETLRATAGGSVALDGRLDDWEGCEWIELAPPDDWITLYDAATGDEDISARFSARWDDRHLWLVFDVVDDHQSNQAIGQPELIWRGDSVQAAFDVALNGGTPYDKTDDFEYGWARAESAQRAWRWVAPPRAAAMANTYVIVRSGTRTIYEIALPPSDLGLSRFAAGQRIGFTVLINDADNGERVGFLQWTPGIASLKSPADFGLLILSP